MTNPAAPRPGRHHQETRMQLDQKTELHYRQVAMNMACANHGGSRDADTVVTTAEKFYAFMACNQMSADAPHPITGKFPQPSGMPGPVVEEFTAFPAETLDSVMVKEMSPHQLREARRVRLFELDVLANEQKLRGQVPC